jgi:CubicO group peptidase (beta-lactamase class C family)
MRCIRTAVAIWLAFAGLVSQAGAQHLPTAKAEDVGLSTARLEHLGAVIQEYVDADKIAGGVALVVRSGKVAFLEGFGYADRETGTPMTPETIFRIASMTKPVTSVAAMMLVEEGRLLLSDPVSKYIPSFADATVAVSDVRGKDVIIRREAAKRPITIRHLLTHTSGISYGTGVVDSIYRAAGVHMWYFADKDEPIGASIDKLAELPFASHPGDAFVYGFSTDVLGHVVEEVSRMSLDQFFETRILEPLDMNDTHFYLPPADARRLAAVYSATPDGAIVRAPDEGMGQGDYLTGPRQNFSGGAGLLSTATDYARFLQMLLNGGELDGTRLLSPKTVELMTSNHVGDLFNDGRHGFGLGFAVVEHPGRAGRHASAGEYSWGGAYYTLFWVDPQEELIGILMAQLVPSGGLDLQSKFRNIVYSSIIESYWAPQVTGGSWPDSVTAQSAARQEDEEDALRAVQAFLDAINNRDTAAYRALVLAEVKNLIIVPQGDSIVYRWRSTEESVDNLGSEGPDLHERIWEAQVRVNGPIADVWSPYDFYVDGEFSHCGIDAFQLVRTDAGWRIGAIAYTVIREKEECPPSPLGLP